MNKELLFLKPIFQETLWGGNRMSEFGYVLPKGNIGECWAVSAHENFDCVIANGRFAHTTLGSLWREHRELFGNIEGDRFPLLVKILDAGDDLSIQVHPDDEYARIHENGALGKTECWYILDCKENATIIVGHNAKSHEELEKMIKEHRFNELIREIPIKKGDFIQIEPGTLHAIKAGTLLLETQQNSDITYRVYDYDRLQNGKPRELHIDKSIAVICAPHVDAKNVRSTVEVGSLKREKLVTCKYYTVEKLDLCGECDILQEHAFMNVSVICGYGEIDGKIIKKGDHFIIPYDYGCAHLKGELSMIVSYV